MKKYFSIIKSVLLAAVVVTFGSCKDAWNDHYSYKETESKYPVDKIAGTLNGISGYSNFYEALRTTRMCDKHGTPINITYLDLLSEDQFLTVWAPSNSADVDWDLYTKKDKTPAEHKEVGEKFIENHIARFKHSVGAGTDEKIYMLNGKPYKSKADAISGAGYHGDDKNIRCSNGVLHCIEGALGFLPNLYEFITTDPQYKEVFGNWFKSYTVQELDPSRSVAQGINENGEMVYVDSVMTEYSVLLSEFGYINCEDSTFALVLPTPEVWTETYNRIKKHFVYREEDFNNDSLQQFYTYTTMMGDMFFNMNKKVNMYLPDSVFSTEYYAYENRRDGKPYHIFSNPYDKVNGLFGSCIDSIECSNGTIYIINKWPFEDELTYLRPIIMEFENYSGNIGRFTTLYQTIRYIDDVELENPIQVMRLSMKGMNKWDAQFYIRNTLKGKYEVKLVAVPNLVTSIVDPEDSTKTVHQTFQIHPKIAFDTPTTYDSILLDPFTYDTVYTSSGKPRQVKKELILNNNVRKIDTMLIGTIEVPYCGYAMPGARLSVTLSSRVESTLKYTSEAWLDCLILEPVVE